MVFRTVTEKSYRKKFIYYNNNKMGHYKKKKNNFHFPKLLVVILLDQKWFFLSLNLFFCFLKLHIAKRITKIEYVIDSIRGWLEGLLKLVECSLRFLFFSHLG